MIHHCLISQKAARFLKGRDGLTVPCDAIRVIYSHFALLLSTKVKEAVKSFPST